MPANVGIERTLCYFLDDTCYELGVWADEIAIITSSYATKNQFVRIFKDEVFRADRQLCIVRSITMGTAISLAVWARRRARREEGPASFDRSQRQNSHDP